MNKELVWKLVGRHLSPETARNLSQCGYEVEPKEVYVLTLSLPSASGNGRKTLAKFEILVLGNDATFVP